MLCTQKKVKDFNDLVFKDYLIAKDMSNRIGVTKQAKITFDNGTELSMVFGELFYSNGIDTYKAWASNVEDDLRGYLTKDEVSEYMKEL
jgi:IS30 family transposase